MFIPLLQGNGSVPCGEAGYDKYAIIKPNDLPYEFLAGHLSNCASGEYKSGQVVAQSGDSRLGTGAQALRCIGKVPTQAEFLADVGMQKAIAGCYWGEVMPQIEVQTSDLTQQCRTLASYHYSGDINLWNNTRPQWTDKGEYPSIAQYLEEVCS